MKRHRPGQVVSTRSASGAAKRRASSPLAGLGIERNTFLHLAGVYRRRWNVGLCAVDSHGATLLDDHAEGWDGPAQQQARRTAVEEALRWGEPAVQPAPGEIVVWAVPLMHNATLLGGLVAGISERRLFKNVRGIGIARPSIDVRAACTDLLSLAERENLTNAALLQSRREQHQRERTRAEAIHAFKASGIYDLRSFYLLQEPLLMAAIRRGDRGQARAILNQLLVGMLHRSGQRLDLAKSFFMELVSTMSRTAVEAGGAPEEVLGTNFDSLSRLSRIADDEQLAAWLHEMLERIMDSIKAAPSPPSEMMLMQALSLMGRDCGQNTSRSGIAQQVGMSDAHFSRQFKAHFGKTFTEVLMQMRADRAADMLARGDKPLKLIAIDCGFSDQSHLTKVFRRHYRVTPAQYRRGHQGSAVS